MRDGPAVRDGRKGRHVVDVLVVGAGPAGAVAARECARAGANVLLVDKARFPRDKVCGSCLGGAALAHLRELAINVPAGRPLASLELSAAGRHARLALPRSLVLSRWALDAALLEEAARAGVAVATGVAATLGPVDGAARVVTVGKECIRARVVLAATGLGPGLLPPVATAPRSRIGVGARLDRAQRDEPDDAVTMVCGRDGYVGMVRDETDRWNVAAALSPRALAGRTPGDAVSAILTAAGHAPLPAACWRGTPALTRRAPAPAERVLALGDAAGYVEPFTGEGIGWALGGGRAVVSCALADWSDDVARRWCRERRRLVRTGVCRAAAFVLRRPRLTAGLIALLGLAPAVAAPWLRRVNDP